jgi:CBS-domain-containing membrane protein
MVYEWRGALFRVRLARLRLTPASAVAARVTPALPRLRAPIQATALTLGGTTAFALGATFGLWPVWAAGLLAVCVSLLFYRP